MATKPGRPTPVGDYEVLKDHEWPTASVRILRLGHGGPIEAHVHLRSMQIYVALEGRSVVTIDGTRHVLDRHDAIPVWSRGVHSASAESETSVLMNISIPPLAEDDQIPASAAHVPPDLALPDNAVDVDD